MIMFYRDPWIKPLKDYELGSVNCNICKLKFVDNDFVTSCEFCDIGTIHDKCIFEHIYRNHKVDLDEKVKLHRERKIHDYQ